MSRVAAWRRTRRCGTGPSHPIVAAVECESDGWLAALSDGRIVTGPDAHPADSAAALALGVRRCEGIGRPVRALEQARSRIECQRMLDAEALARMCGRDDERPELMAAVDRRIAKTLRDAARRERATIAAIGQLLRMFVSVPRALGLERALLQLLERPHDPGDVSWLRDTEALMAREQPRRSHDRDPRMVALIVLGRSR
jgi:hypothetical protein